MTGKPRSFPDCSDAGIATALKNHYADKIMLTQKEAVAQIKEEISNTLAKNRVLERYWRRLFSGGEKKYGQQLGQVQGQIREQEQYIEFLDEIAAEDEPKP